MSRFLKYKIIFSNLVPKNKNVYVIGLSTGIQSNYFSALTKNHPVYSLGSCSIVNRYYEAIQLTVSTSGCYAFIIKSDINIIMTIYIDSFYLFYPRAEYFAYNHGNQNNTLSNFTVQLDATVVYVLIVTTYLPHTMGNFSIVASGTSKVNFNHMGKSRVFIIFLQLEKIEFSSHRCPISCTSSNIYIKSNAEFFKIYSKQRST